jgi:hypothetical protein
MVSFIQDGQPRRPRLDPRDAHRFDKYSERELGGKNEKICQQFTKVVVALFDCLRNDINC